jgi:hypothetical protein
VKGFTRFHLQATKVRFFCGFELLQAMQGSSLPAITLFPV